MQCLKCNSNSYVKSGKVANKQRYRCRDCGYQFTRTTPRGKPASVKRMALHLYLEGVGLRAIGRILGVSNVAVLKWVKNCAEEIKQIKKDEQPKEIRVMELDEMWSFIQKKEERFGSGLLLIEKEEELSTFILAQEQ